MKKLNKQQSQVKSILKSFENYFSQAIDCTVESNNNQKHVK